MLKQLVNSLLSLFLNVVYALFSLLPVKTASRLGGFLGRLIGPHLRSSKIADVNLEAVFPELSANDRRNIILGMWSHLGRMLGEYPHLKTIASDTYTEIKNAGILDTLNTKDNKHGAIFCGGHLGNFELNAAAVLVQKSFHADLTYRAPNNPTAEKLLSKARNIDDGIKAYAKSAEGGKKMILALKNGRSLGILVDQKYNQGLSVPFFGYDAMTNPVFVQLAQKYNVPIIPIRNIRLDGVRFKLILYKPLVLFDEQGKPLPVENVIQEFHSLLEGWIKEHPDQWLWAHDRWKFKPRD